MTGFGRPEDEPSSVVLNFLKPVKKMYLGVGKIALQQSNLDSTKAQIRVFVTSSDW